MKNITWNANRDRFTERQAERIAYGAIVRMVVRIEAMPNQKDREDAENALATLLGDVPAFPSISMSKGMDYIETIKRRLQRERRAALLAEESERRCKIRAQDPLVLEMQRAAARRPYPLQDLADCALFIVRTTRGQRAMRLPRRSS